MKIAIPTYNRDIIKTAMLLSAFDPNDVYIFPNNYGDKLGAEVLKLTILYPEFHVVGLDTKGIGEARNGILNYFPAGEEIVMLDDDIDLFERLVIEEETLKGKLSPLDNEEIKVLFEQNFAICKNNETKLWGVYPVRNAFFMKNRVYNKGFCIGTVLGIIVNDLRFDPLASFKEDYDYTLQNIIKYKKICRFDYITIKAGHYTNKGGVCEQRKADPEKEGRVAKYLIRKYPGLVRANSKRPNEILITL